MKMPTVQELCDIEEDAMRNAPTSSWGDRYEMRRRVLFGAGIRWAIEALRTHPKADTEYDAHTWAAELESIAKEQE